MADIGEAIPQDPNDYIVLDSYNAEGAIIELCVDASAIDLLIGEIDLVKTQPILVVRKDTSGT